ncbi:TetR family transcriptional regulator [Microbacterium trichothecenolyticum]|uniref:HTH-type transcriptional regulator BetI n=1 Tax=Microbacterium trichothecenolyticum TaxID=69370 RepID=A0A0M2HHP2_MICTR|nr:TetR family transcriptional regulator [Microbacterium trichothecenolyticum]KJL43835.1 HTH-type transcriptional regulator BetI [Microbacterium trichothecenolyticum]
MGNREDLLAGARQVILERGVAKATARDIAAAAGVSLAAIGYHFGSKDELISAALTESLGSGIGDAMEAIVDETAALPLIDGFATLFDRMPEIFAANREALVASLENSVRVSRDAGASRALADATEQAHLGIVEVLRSARPDLGPADLDAIAKLEFVLVQSLGLLWIISPESLPTGDELARAVTAIAGDGAGGAWTRPSSTP